MASGTSNEGSNHHEKTVSPLGHVTTKDSYIDNKNPN